MKYYRGLQQLFLLSFLTLQTMADVKLKVDCDVDDIVYSGERDRNKGGVLKINTVKIKGVVQEDIAKYTRELGKHAKKVIHVGVFVRRLVGVDGIVALYEKIPVRIQSKISGKVYCGFQAKDETLEIIGVEDSQGSNLDKDCQKMITELIPLKNTVFYFADNTLCVLNNAAESEGTVYVSYSNQPVMLSVQMNSSLLYRGIRVKEGEIEINQINGSDGKTVEITSSSTGEELKEKNTAYVYMGKEMWIRKCNEVTNINAKSFTVIYSKIPTKFSINVPGGPFYRGNVYQSWKNENNTSYSSGSTQIWQIGNNPISAEFHGIKAEFDKALSDNAKIFIDNEGYIRKICRIVTPQDLQSIVVYYRLFIVTLEFEGFNNTSFLGHYKCQGWITVTGVFVDGNESKLDKSYSEDLKLGFIRKPFTVELKRQILIDVVEMLDGRFEIQYVDEE